MNKLILLSLFVANIIINPLLFSKDNKIFLITAGNDINVRFLPNSSAEIITKLNIGHFVELISNINKIEILNGKKGKWAYIDTECYINNDIDNNTLKGWVFDYYLAHENDFKTVVSWPYKEISGCIGDYQFAYKFTKDGNYIKSHELIFLGDPKLDDPEGPWKECKKEGGYITNQNKCIIKGHLYQYLKLIKGKGDYFFIDDTNILRYAEDPEIYCEPSN